MFCCTISKVLSNCLLKFSIDNKYSFQLSNSIAFQFDHLPKTQFQRLIQFIKLHEQDFHQKKNKKRNKKVEKKLC